MIDEVSATLRQLGVDADRVHGEHFTLATTTAADRASEAAAAAAPGGPECEARCRQRQGREVQRLEYLAHPVRQARRLGCL